MPPSPIRSCLSRWPCCRRPAARSWPPAQWRAEDTESIITVDCHAHIFTSTLPLADERRYAPDYNATAADYLSRLDRHGIEHGVLVQPSFLGTDNSYLLAALAAHPRLRGIVVTEPVITRAELDDFDGAGIVGVRLNLIRRPDPDFSTESWERHLADIAELGWQIEIQAEAWRLRSLLPPLLGTGIPLVIDHFGRPDPHSGIDDPGFRYLLSQGGTGRVWVKLSGAYRNGGPVRGGIIAAAAVPLLREAFGLDRLVWGSDWPHTQHEWSGSYEAALAQLEEWLPDAHERVQVRTENPCRLFGL